MISANPEAMKARLAAIDKVNREQIDEEKGAHEVDNV